MPPRVRDSRAPSDEDLPVNYPRCSGVLLHPTSLPGQGIGELGEAAFRFVDWLAGAGQALWQVLPLVPVGEGGSPYDGLSAMAGNPLLVDVGGLTRLGLLQAAEPAENQFPSGRVDYDSVRPWKDELLRQACAAFRGGAAPALRTPFRSFRERHAGWLNDYTLFETLREERAGAPWTEWERPLRLRESAALAQARSTFKAEIERHAWNQFLFDYQWSALRRYAHSRGVRIIGDIPIFVALNSADVWANQELFQLDAEGQPEVVAGVPPDYFSETGQRWGNPLPHWERMREGGFRWWTQRFRRTLELVDIARVDHFRGFQAYWAIPPSDETALNGQWRPGPGAELFHAVERELGPLPLIAEDLGLITPEVEVLRDELELPGMRVLEFAFDGDPENPHLPSNYVRHTVAYTGTHDNDTTLGWWSNAGEDVRAQLRRVVGETGEPVNWAMIRAALESAADLAVVPLQDLFGLGTEARMNTPGTVEDNWAWRFAIDDLDADVQSRLFQLTRSAGRQYAFPAPADHL
jgi:4-alpha-glucanotransferase